MRHDLNNRAQLHKAAQAQKLPKHKIIHTRKRLPAKIPCYV